MSSEIVLETDEMTKLFGSLVANDKISLSVERGEIRGIIGPNGSGKTTFFNTLTGFYESDGGRVTFDGTEITNWAPYEVARRGLGRTFQIPSPFDEMTVRQNLLAVHTPDDVGDRHRRANDILELIELDHLADNDAGDLSGGQQKLLELGRVLMLDPECILLDEPTAGVNPALEARLLEYIKEVNADGTSFVIVEHDMDVIRDIADKVTVFDNGEVLVEGTFEEVTSNEHVQEAYLGKNVDGDELLSRQRGDIAGDVSERSTGDGSDRTLEANDIVTGYGKHEVLHGVSIESCDGITGIFGPNGSGKSTLMKALNGLVPVWSGSVTYGESDITDESADEVFSHGIVTLPQDSGVFTSLTVEDNLRLGAYTVDSDDVVESRLESVFETFPVLEEKLNAKAGSLSGGQRMMLSFGRTMMTGADVFLLDEPSAGLAPSIVDDVFDMVEKLAAQGNQVILIEQNVQAVLPIVDHVYILAKGEVQFDGTPAELTENDELLDVYLGIS